MKITSPVFKHNQLIPATYTCDGQNINPPLEIAEIPTNTQDLVLIVDDPDAQAGSWIHWTMWNINLKLTKIEENTIPSGSVQGITSFGTVGYDGPCPPSGTHRYFFKVFALDIKLNLGSETNATDLQQAMAGHIIAQAELIGLYQGNN
jgi:Raf kinase inhibitor-like YbhB/YbcL family protein